MGPSRWGASLLARKIEVGPSAPPIIPIAAASLNEKPNINAAPIAATKIPICAAAPKRKVKGRPSNGLKSVRTPIPRNMMGGNNSVLIPLSYIRAIIPFPYEPRSASGKFAKTIPNDMVDGLIHVIIDYILSFPQQPC